MLSAALVTSDAQLSRVLQDTANASRSLQFVRVFDLKANNWEVARVCSGLGLDVIIIDYQDVDRATALSEAMSRSSPNVARIGVSSRSEGYHSTMPPDLHGWLPSRSIERLDDVVHVAVARRDRVSQVLVPGKVFLFLPAKAGCGASTIALHVANALANHLDAKTLYIDADLRSGVSAMHLNLDPPFSLRDALARSGRIDSTGWNELVVRSGKLELLCSRPDQEGPLPVWSEYYHLLDFARRRYDAVIFDLPELLNVATFEAARAANQLLLVTTAEVVALKLAAQRLADLAKAGVETERVGLVLNRYHKGDAEISEIERVLGVQVSGFIPNDYRVVQRAIYDGQFASAKTNVGKSAIEFAAHLLGKPVASAGCWRKLFA